MDMDGRLALFDLFDRWDRRDRLIPIGEIADELGQLKLRATDLAGAIAFHERTYRRCSIRRSPHYEALVLCWKSGQRSPIHDHRGSSCGVLIVRGRATETLFSRSPCGRLVPRRSRRLGPGQVAAGHDRAIHQMGNLERPGCDLITLHVYSPPPTGWRQYPLDESTLGDHDSLAPAPGETEAVSLALPHRYRVASTRPRRFTMSVEETGMAETSIAIVGAGFSGTMVAHHLVHGPAAADVTIRLFEKGRRFARGLAYSTEHDCHLLNVPAAMMSALPDETSHFFEWLKARDPSAEPGTFARRKVYGEYLATILDEAVQASAGRLQLSSDEVVDLAEAGDDSQRLRVTTASGRQFDADQVILALGNPPAQDPTGGRAAEMAGYTADPWSPGLFDGVDLDDDLLLIGTGLTSVDVFLEARSRGHRGTIYAMSRHGLRPYGHRAAPPRPHFALADRRNTARSLLGSIRREAQVCEGEGGDWRSVIDSLRPQVPTLWRSMEPEERARFVRHLAPRWDVHRHRVAPAIEAALHEAERDGRLVVVAGRVEAMFERGRQVAVHYRPRGNSELVTRVVRKVINCTGPGRDIRRSSSALLGALFSRGLARPGPLALGLDVADDGRLLDASGRPQARLVALGPILKDAFWETTAVRELRSQAHAVARSLHAHRGA